jgi:hypothetical protein
MGSSKVTKGARNFQKPMKTVIGFVTLKRVLITLLHNTFKLLSINGHYMRRGVAQIIFTQHKFEKGVVKYSHMAL